MSWNVVENSNPNGVEQQSPGLAQRQPWVLAQRRPSTPTGLRPSGRNTGPYDPLRPQPRWGWEGLRGQRPGLSLRSNPLLHNRFAVEVAPATSGWESGKLLDSLASMQRGIRSPIPRGAEPLWISEMHSG